MLNPYELGMIVSRIALTDQIFVKNILEAAENAGPKILSNNLDKLKIWMEFIRARALCCERKIPSTLKTVSGRTKPNGGSDGWTGHTGIVTSIHM